MNFRYTILYVEDVRASLDFFNRAFGFDIAFLHESGDYGELSTGATKLACSSMALMRQLGKHPHKPSLHAPAFELAFETEDVTAALIRAQAAGATLVQAEREMPWGQVIAYVGDPNGYLIEICTPAQLPSPG